MDKRRRDLLSLLSATGSAMLLPVDVDWERMSDVFTKYSQLETLVVQDLEAITTHYGSLYLTTSSKSSVVDGIVCQLRMLMQFLKRSHTASIHQRLCALASELAQLAGEIFFDMHTYEAAQTCYAFAITAAKEAKSYDLWACALTRHAFLPLYDEHYNDALLFLNEAHYLARRGDTQLPTQHWIAAVEAEAHSGIHNLVACQEALEQAYKVTAVNETSLAWVRFESSRLPALCGTCYVRLPQLELAEPALQEALQHDIQPGRKRGMVLTDLASACIQRQEVEQACVYMNEAIDIIDVISSDFYVRVYVNYNTYWSHLQAQHP